MTSGRTEPLLLVCERPDGELVEVVAKVSAGCDQREENLTREVIASCLAGDLGLPIPEPFLVELPQAWIASVPEGDVRAKIERSSPVAFASKLMTGQFAVWTSANRISEAMLPSAAAVFVFDAIVQNSDRRVGNPNCLVRGDAIRIIDHELTFAHRLILNWKPPWELGGLSAIEMPGFHVFRSELTRRPIDFNPIRDAWRALSDTRVRSYELALPAEWGDGPLGAARAAIELICEARDRFDACLQEVQRVLR